MKQAKKAALDTIVDRELSRRDFFKWVFRASVMASLFGLIDQISCGTLKLPPGQGSWFMQPQTEDEKTVYAICDTILPGTATDPGGAPGANDVGTLNVIYDKFYPAVQYLPAILVLIESAVQTTYGHGKKFYDLSMAQRTDLLAGIEGRLGIIDLLYKYIRAPFYVGILSNLGPQYMGYPGPNLGYREQDFSFHMPMSKEMTPNGNRP